MFRSCRASAALFVLAALLAAAARAEPLPALGADGPVTVSGVSSGGYMAGQFLVAHSSAVRGAAIMAAGPYYCAQGSVVAAYFNCTTPRRWTPLPAASLLQARARLFSQGGQIDPISNLASARVWLFAGLRDDVVLPEVVAAARGFYDGFKASTLPVTHPRAGHAMITAGVGGPCSESAAPYINDCGYDAAGELLRFLLGTLSPPRAKQGGRLVAFSQSEFAAGDPQAISLGEEGYVFVPRECEAGGCRVHVAFHGCQQYAGKIGEGFARDAGYNRWADTNRLVVLYPQTVARYFPVFNPLGCWDWWGYTGPLYATKLGAQVAAVQAMLRRLAQSPTQSRR